MRIGCLCLLLFVLAAHCPSFAQQCNNRYSALRYKAISFETFTTIAATPANEMVAAGNVYEDHGFITKFSANGTPLFSYQYTPVYQQYLHFYKRLKFSQVIATKDEGFVAAGNQLDTSYSTFNRVGILLKTDKYGHILWSKKFANRDAEVTTGLEMALTNVVETAGGDLVVFLASDYGGALPNYSLVVCLASNGDQKWATYLAGSYDSGVPSLDKKRGLFQSKNGNIVCSEFVYKTDRSTVPALTTAAWLHIFFLDPLNGKFREEAFYTYPVATRGPFPEVIDVAEMPNGSYVFSTSFVETPQGRKGLRITTDAHGVFVKGSAYQSVDGSGTSISGVATDKSGQQTILLTKRSGNLLAKIDANDAFIWQRGLRNSSGLFPANAMAVTGKGYAVFGSNFTNRDVQLLLTDKEGNIDCVNEEAGVKNEPLSLTRDETLKTDPSRPLATNFIALPSLTRADDWPVQMQVDCQALPDCCHDVVDSSQAPLHLCEGTSLTLPGNTVVSSAGTYYKTYQAASGCDSIVFYKVKVDKSLLALQLEKNQCFNGSDSVVITAPDGYENYYWNNSLVPTAQNSITVRAAGTYQVTVKNSCGKKTETINVFNQCQFPIYMPSAFTPNNDGRNDVFVLPAQNKNVFVSLKVFNRWGQMLFSTNNAAKGWNGTVRGQPAETGVYVYFLEMKSLSGEPIAKKGTVLLVR